MTGPTSASERIGIIHESLYSLACGGNVDLALHKVLEQLRFVELDPKSLQILKGYFTQYADEPTNEKFLTLTRESPAPS